MDELSFVRRMQRRRTLQNVVLVWLEPNSDTSGKEYQYLQTQLSGIIDKIELCDNPDQCIDFCTNFEDVKVLMIIPDMLAQQLIPCVCDIPQLYSIYVLCGETPCSEEVMETKPKLKGFFHTIHDICKLIQLNIRQYDHNSVPISVISSSDCSNQNLNKLEPLFMYSRLLKEILFDMDRRLHTKERFYNFYASNTKLIRQIYASSMNLNKITNRRRQSGGTHEVVSSSKY